jgi:hypothetical protein
MPETPVQNALGNAVIASVSDFAKSDIRTVAQLVSVEFCHVGDSGLRKSIAEIFYGARWLYKLGLVLLVKDEEQFAHVRAQVLDYGAVCEGLLSDMVEHGIDTAVLGGDRYQYEDAVRLQRPIAWGAATTNRARMEKRSFSWLIKVAEQEGIVTPSTAAALDRLRLERNKVHARARTYGTFLSLSKRSLGRRRSGEPPTHRNR